MWSAHAQFSDWLVVKWKGYELLQVFPSLVRLQRGCVNFFHLVGVSLIASAKQFRKYASDFVTWVLQRGWGVGPSMERTYGVLLGYTLKTKDHLLFWLEKFPVDTILAKTKTSWVGEYSFISVDEDHTPQMGDCRVLSTEIVVRIYHFGVYWNSSNHF